uniref:Secreted protein n=1 Tax=Physcomitrium patens TaxID=3218 RepID=A0A2K1JL88_PHYPA|nr:hypothetical protein PHYPA_017132 [Physcomitrium patens]
MVTILVRCYLHYVLSVLSFIPHTCSLPRKSCMSSLFVVFQSKVKSFLALTMSFWHLKFQQKDTVLAASIANECGICF